MSYETAVAGVIASRGDYPLAIIAIARAAAALGRDVGSRGDVLMVDGAAIVTASGTLSGLGPVGVVYKSLLAPPGNDFRVVYDSPAAGAYGEGSLSKIFGSDAAEMLASLRKVWVGRIAALGVDIRVPLAALDAGVMAYPVAGASLPAWWNDMAQMFAPMVKAYYSQAYKVAAAAARVADLAADRWAAVVSALEAIRDLPANLVTGAVGAVGRAIGVKNWLLIGAVALAFLAFLFRGALISKVKTYGH